MLDSTDDNISCENGIYGELAGLYWVWKNATSEYFAFFHYNKYLDIKENKAIEALNGHYDMIVAKQGTFIDHAFPDEYSAFLEEIRKYNSDFFDIYCKVLNAGGSGHFSGQNMFIAKREIVDEYCEFLFGLLKHVRTSIGEGQTNPNDKRYCAYFAERLLTPWLIYRDYTYLEAPLRMMGPWYYQVIRRFKYSRFFRLVPSRGKAFINRVVRRSSYKS